MGKLITPSIMNSVAFAKNASGKWREKGRQDLFNQLSRIYPAEMPHAIRRGLDFEDRVYQCARMDPEHWTSSDAFRAVVDECRGGSFQAKAKRDISVDGEVFTLYGKLDVKFPELIIDLKTTNKRQPPGKYLGTPQHLIYSYSTGIKNFRYLVIVLDENDQIVEVYPIDWESPGEEAVENVLITKIRQFMKDLESFGMLELYHDKFCLY